MKQLNTLIDKEAQKEQLMLMIKEYLKTDEPIYLNYRLIDKKAPEFFNFKRGAYKIFFFHTEKYELVNEEVPPIFIEIFAAINFPWYFNMPENINIA